MDFVLWKGRNPGLEKIGGEALKFKALSRW